MSGDHILFAAPAGGLIVELERSHNIVIRQPHLGVGNDTRITVTNVDALVSALALTVEYRDAREQGAT